jgi:hypothetical protein
MVVSSDWLAVIAISVAVMAVVQVATLIGVFVALRRIQIGARTIERRLELAVEEFRPELARLVEDARAASTSAKELVEDVRAYIDSAEEAAHSVRQRVARVVDGVQTALPVPMKFSGPAAVGLWAALRVARSLLSRRRDRRRGRNRREHELQDVSYLGVG